MHNSEYQVFVMSQEDKSRSREVGEATADWQLS